MEEGLPLYIKDGERFRVGTEQNEAHSRVAGMLRDGAWFDLAVYEAPPAWGDSLYIRRSDLDLHQKFFGAYWDWDDPKRAESARALRKEAFKLAIERRDSDDPSVRVLGKFLQPVIEIWPMVKEILGVSGMQAILFTEETFFRLRLTLYVQHEDSGFWVPRPFGKSIVDYLAQMGCSDYAHAFANGVAKSKDEWDDLRLTPQDCDALLRRRGSSLSPPRVSMRQTVPPLMSCRVT